MGDNRMYTRKFFKLILLGVFFLCHGSVFAKTPPLVSCENDSACASNQTCAPDILNEHKKFCLKKCTTSSDCSLSWYCHPKMGLCHHFCKDTSDCPENHICTHELSAKKEGHPLCLKQCQSDSDCAAPLYCSSNGQVCRKYCENDSDCSEGKVCRKKKCKNP
jgi:hypothetical protein